MGELDHQLRPTLRVTSPALGAAELNPLVEPIALPFCSFTSVVTLGLALDIPHQSSADSGSMKSRIDDNCLHMFAFHRRNGEHLVSTAERARETAGWA